MFAFRWRSKPSYSYTHFNGVIKKSRTVPVLLYMLGVSLPMAAAVFMASAQVHNKPAAPKAASVATIAKPGIQAQIASPVNQLGSQDSQLQGVIDSFITAHPDHKWSVQVQGLDGNERSASYNAATQFNSASIYKLLMMYPLMQKTPISQWGQVSVNVVGSNSTLSNCVTAMLRISDNDCGDAVGDYVGWSYATNQLRSIGLGSTNLNDPAGPVTTAADVNYYLQGLYEGKWFDGATRSFILNVLSQQVLRSGIPAGCGKTCSVADKTGDVGSVRHDAGIVHYAGGAYVLSVFSDGASYADIAQLAHQIQVYMAVN